MRLVRCLICSREFSSAGIGGHLRFKHGIIDAKVGEHYELTGNLESKQEIEQTIPMFPQNYNNNVPRFIPQSGYIPQNPEVEKKKAELEMKKLEIEIKNLEKPDTSIDYYGKMLEMSDKHHQETLKLLSEKYDAKLEAIENSEGENDDISDWIEIIKMFANKKQEDEFGNGAADFYVTPTTAAAYNQPQQQGGKMDTKKILLLIKQGIITEKEAYDYLATQNELFTVLFTPEEFHTKFELLKTL